MVSLSNGNAGHRCGRTSRTAVPNASGTWALPCLTLLPSSLTGRPRGGALPSDIECANGAKTLQRLFQFPAGEGQLIPCQRVPGQWQVTRGGPMATRRSSPTTGRGKAPRMTACFVGCLKDTGVHIHTVSHAATRAVPSDRQEAPPSQKSLLHASRCHLSPGESEGDETAPQPRLRVAASARGDDAQLREVKGNRDGGLGSPQSPRLPPASMQRNQG